MLLPSLEVLFRSIWGVGNPEANENIKGKKKNQQKIGEIILKLYSST